MGAKVREKRPGDWWVVITHHGKRRSKRVGRDKKLATDVANKIQARLTLGDLGLAEQKEKVPTFKEYAEKWLEGYIKGVRRLSTYQRYKIMLVKYGYPAIGKMPLNEIKRATIRELLLNLNKKGLSKSTISLMRDVLSGPLSFALDEELIPFNPITGLLKALHIERDKREHIDPLTHENVSLFLKICTEHFREYYPFFLCAFRTGMRMGELLALRWGDIDWTGRFIEVRRSYKLGRMTPTKTGKMRRVDMSDQLFQTLRSLFVQRKEEALSSGTGEIVEVIFHRNGEPMEQNFIRRVFKRVLSKAGLREIRFHDIRHTYASLLLSEAASPVYVKEQLGHSSIQMTVDIYGHLIPSSNRAFVNRLDLRPSAPQVRPPEKEKAQPIEIAPLPKEWCRRGDSNPYVATHTRP